MTLGRLLKLYDAEKQGKQIMMRVYHSGYYSSYESTEEVKITECELRDLIDNEDSIFFYIKDEEDEFGYSIK